jgi:hypothetical protein
MVRVFKTKNGETVVVLSSNYIVCCDISLGCVSENVLPKCGRILVSYINLN